MPFMGDLAAYTNYSSILPPLSGKPTPAQEAPRILFTKILDRDLPGQSTDNRYAQVDNYTGAVYVAVNAIMDGLKGAKIRLEKKTGKGDTFSQGDENDSDGWKPVGSDHPAARLFDYVNPEQTLRSFIAQYAMMLELTGRVFLYAVPGEMTGKPVEMWILSTPYVTPMFQTSPDYPKGAWQVTLPTPAYGLAGGSGMYTIIDARNIVEHRLPHPRYFYDGYSPLTAGGEQLDGLRSINQSRKNTMERGTSVDTIIQIKGATENELRKAESQYQNKYTGQTGSKTIFTSGDDLAIGGITGSKPSELEFSQGYEQLTKFVMSLFGVPSPISGLTDAGSYSQLYASLQQFRTNKLIPMALDISEHLTKHLIAPYWGRDLRLVLELPALQNEDQAFQRYQHDSDILTVNQRLAMDNKQPVPGGDVPAPIYVAKLQGDLQAEQQQKQAAMQAQQAPQGMPGEGEQGADGVTGDSGNPMGSPPPSAPGGQAEPSEGEGLLNGAILDALGMSSSDGPTVRKSLGHFWKALQVEQVPTKSGAFAVKYSGGNRTYYGKQAKEIWEKAQKIGSAKEDDKDDKSVKIGDRRYTGPNAMGAAIEFKDDTVDAPVKPSYGDKITDDITGGISPPPKGADKTPSGIHSPKPGQVAPLDPEAVDLGGQSANDEPKMANPPKATPTKEPGKFTVRGAWKNGQKFEVEVNAGNQKDAEAAFAAMGAHIDEIPEEAQAEAHIPMAKLVENTLPVAKRVQQLAKAQRIPVAKLLPTKRPSEWAHGLADTHAPMLSKKLGISPESAHALIKNLAIGFLRGLVSKLKIPGINLQSFRSWQAVNNPRAERLPASAIQDAEALTPDEPAKPVNRIKNPANPPRNKAGKGSLPPRLGKSFNPDEPRGDHGQWISGGSGANAAKASRSLVGENGDLIANEHGRIDVQHSGLKYSPRGQSVVDFVVNEESRGKGHGDKLLKQALAKYSDLGGQVSSAASLKVFYNNGFRPPHMPTASFEEVLKEFKDDGGSLYMAHKDDDGKPYVPTKSVGKSFNRLGKSLARYADKLLATLGAE